MRQAEVVRLFCISFPSGRLLLSADHCRGCLELQVRLVGPEDPTPPRPLTRWLVSRHIPAGRRRRWRSCVTLYLTGLSQMLPSASRRTPRLGPSVSMPGFTHWCLTRANIRKPWAMLAERRCNAGRLLQYLEAPRDRNGARAEPENHLERLPAPALRRAGRGGFLHSRSVDTIGTHAAFGAFSDRPFNATRGDRRHRYQGRWDLDGSGRPRPL